MQFEVPLSDAQSLRIRTYDEDGSELTAWDEALGWLEPGTAENENGDHIMIQTYHPYTPQQLEEKRIADEKAALDESRRQLTFEEAATVLLQLQLNNSEIPDQTSLRMMAFYPAFSDVVGHTVKLGFKFTHEGQLYKTAQPDLTIQAHYPPGAGTESLYTRIDLDHTGAVYDPIPYSGNMELFSGKYYTQDGALYLCTRDTGAAVHHPLSELVGLYVEEI